MAEEVAEEEVDVKRFKWVLPAFLAVGATACGGGRNTRRRLEAKPMAANRSLWSANKYIESARCTCFSKVVDAEVSPRSPSNRCDLPRNAFNALELRLLATRFREHAFATRTTKEMSVLAAAGARSFPR